jgi:hypothetical protein
MKLAAAQNATSQATGPDSAIVRRPTESCRASPASPPSVTSLGVLRWPIRVTSNAETPKVRASAANASVGEPSARRTPPRAGPTITTRFSIVALRAFAAASSSSPATSGMVALTAGK